MSEETKTSTGEKINWSLIPISGRESLIDVGRYEFERTDFHLGILQFLAGARSIPLANGAITIDIPENIEKPVKFGHLEMPYEQFVDGIFWALRQQGRYAEEFQVPLNVVNNIALEALEKQVKIALPERNQTLLDMVIDFKKEHLKPEGIFGLKPSTIQR